MFGPTPDEVRSRHAGLELAGVVAQVERRSLFASALGTSLAAIMVPEALAISPGANVFGAVKSKRTGAY